MKSTLCSIVGLFQVISGNLLANKQKDVAFTSELDVQVSVNMGLFETTGISETHQNVIHSIKCSTHSNKEIEPCVNSGITINRCEPRLVSIHSQRLSPLNSQLSLEENRLHSFYSLGIHENRCIITYHLIPESQVMLSTSITYLRSFRAAEMKFIKL
jgi:hypothetical protein